MTGAWLRAGPCHGWKPVRVSAVRPRASLALQPYLPYPNGCQGTSPHPQGRGTKVGRAAPVLTRQERWATPGPNETQLLVRSDGSGNGLLSHHTAAARRGLQELVFMPQSRRSGLPTGPRSSESVKRWVVPLR